jgi:hypothetical protein
MPDQFADQFKRYWAVITVVFLIAAGYGGMMYQVADIKETVSKFVDAGPRYSLRDHNAYVEQQRMLDADQTRRIIILEQKHERTP